MKLNAEFDSTVSVCAGFKAQGGISKLELIEKEKAKLDNENKVVISTDDFKYVDFLGKSCTFQEVYDGYKVTDTITFDIALDNYKPSWQYNLLEFLNNKYSAIIEQKGVDKKYYIGFNYGLQPSYVIQTASQNGQSDTITVSLTEISIYGSANADDWDGTFSGQTEWRYTKQVDCIFGYECVELGIAKYLLKEEVDIFGNPTGNYKVLEGYEDRFPTLNIVGTFSEVVLFPNNDCNDGDICETETDMPNTIEFTSAGCLTYSFKASCDWNVSDLPSNITVSPASGVANTEYTISICNSIQPSESTSIENYFYLNCCDGKRVINCIVYPNDNCIRPLIHYITCLAQTVIFNYNGDCLLNITNVSDGITYTVQNNMLIVQVPENRTTSERVFSLVASNCDCGVESVTLTIIQDKMYEEWLAEAGYICVSGDSYTVERRYTGTTSGNVTTRTEETRPGTLIMENDPRCAEAITKYEWDGEYVCVDGNKYKSLEEYISYDGGVTWEKTGRTKPGEMVESASTYCQSAVTYSWTLTSQFMCSGDTSYYLYQKYQSVEGGTPTPVYPNVYSVDGEGTMPLVKRMDNDPDCGYNPSGTPIYRWVNMGGYYCDECPYEMGYLTFTAQEGGRFKFSGNYIYYSVDDGITWSGLTRNEYSPYVSEGKRIIWKDDVNGIHFNGSTQVYGSGTFSSTGRFTAEGNIMSLLYLDDFEEQTSLSGFNYVFKDLFNSCTGLTSAENLILPATALTNDCYEYMFSYCTNLTTTPQLPATTLAERCYYGMFYGCTSLTTTPSGLPATTLASYCYENMFNGCTRLAAVTSYMLPATNLSEAYRCYAGMFAGCTSLTTTPQLPATNLSGANECYLGMFYGCTSLTTVNRLPASTLANYCYDNMFYGCTALTTVPSNMLPATTMKEDCYLSMFYGCTSLTAVPTLPATTLAQECYEEMFAGCTSLTTAPTLPATNLSGAVGCYRYMFAGCTRLTTVPTLPATRLGQICYEGMFKGCTSLTTAPALYATTLANNCCHYMFKDCTSLTTVPSNMLPATALAQECYDEMFEGCTSLTTAPVLSASTLVDGCYAGMFGDCSSLNNITCLATDISASNCTSLWVHGVAPSGIFTKAASMTSWSISDSGIPSGWTVLPPPEPLISCYSNIVTITCSTPNVNIYYRFNNSGSYSAYTTPISITADTIVQAYSEKNGLSSNTVSQTCQYIDPLEQPLTFVAQEGGTFNFSGNYIYYSIDNGTTWSMLEQNYNSPYVAEGNEIMWKVNGLNIISMGGGVGTFSSSGRFTAKGNAMSLLYEDNFSGQTSLSGVSWAFASLFANCSGLTSAENLILPATNLVGAQECYEGMFYNCTSLTSAPTLPATNLSGATYCYRYMFQGCTSLTTAPSLPATALAEGCYNNMFYNCTSLTTVPSNMLPATTLANYCYNGMFYNCTSLTTVPSNMLPATTLAESCYESMFGGCGSLTTAPTLPATTLATRCYYYMFNGCTRLNNITCLATDISANMSIYRWVYGVASSGTFTKAASMTSWPTSDSGIPSGWTIQNA